MGFYKDLVKASVDIGRGVSSLITGMSDCGVMRDPSKAINAIHWDGLTQEAQEALSKQGFYRKGDDKSLK